jgi:hypothetical protein
MSEHYDASSGAVLMRRGRAYSAIWPQMNESIHTYIKAGRLRYPSRFVCVTSQPASRHAELPRTHLRP